MGRVIMSVLKTQVMSKLAREIFKYQKFAGGLLFTLTSVMKKWVNMVFWMLRWGSKDGVKCTEVKFFFDDEISRCLEVNSTLQTVPFFPFWSKHSRVLAFRPDEIARIQRAERRGCESSLTSGEGECLEVQGEEALDQIK